MKAVAWMFGALLSFSLLAISARELSGEIDIFQSLFIRSATGLVIIVSLILLNKDYSLFITYKPKQHFLRNIFHYIGQYGWFVGIGLLPLAEVFALEFTIPLWTLMIAVFIGEKITKRKMVSIMIGLTGVLVILQPGVTIISSASLVVFGAAIGFSISMVTTKFLSNHEKSITILFYMCLIQMPIGLVWSISGWIQPSALQWFWLIVIGVVSLSAHFCIAQAMRTAEASIVSTLDFLRLPMIMIVGFLFYNEQIHWSIFIGAGLMLLSNIVNLREASAGGRSIK